MSKRILSIDDSKMVHMVVTKTLRPLDVEVLTAINGQEGIEKAEKEKPDLILLDATMPVMDGMEALAALKANVATRDIPVVMIGVDSGKDNVERATQLGALMFITKPFTGDALVASLSQFIDLGQKAA
jgi:CheY-like chemotaxis protein